MRSKILIALFYLWIIGNSSLPSNAHLEENKPATEVQINQGHVASGHGGSGGSQGVAASGGSGSSSSGEQQGVGVVPHNAGGGAQNLRNNHHKGGSSYKKYTGYLTMVAILLQFCTTTLN